MNRKKLKLVIEQNRKHCKCRGLQYDNINHTFGCILSTDKRASQPYSDEALHAAMSPPYKPFYERTGMEQELARFPTNKSKIYFFQQF